MTILDAIWQGIIQGLTEFLPISSSGHLALYQYFTGNNGAGSMFFSLMLHLGTLAAVVAAFYEDIWALLKEFGHMVKDITKGRFSLKTSNPHRKMIFMLILATLPMVLVVPVHGMVGKLAEDKDIIVEGLCFLFTSLLLFIACKLPRGRAGIGKMRPRSALTIGVMQAVAVLPGISRSGSTTATGMILGFAPEFMVKFSFLLSIPAILGGAVFEVGDAVKQGLEINFLVLFVGMLVAAVVGYLAIRLVQWLAASGKYKIFAWYTLVLGVIVVILGIVGHITAGAGGAGVASGVSSAISSASSASGSASSAASVVSQVVTSVVSAG